MLNSTRASGLTFLFPEGDTVVGPTLQRHGEFARPEVDFLALAASDQTGVFLDVGANIGAVALPFARRRPTWRVKAVEAHRGLAQVLSANAFGNHLYNVEVIHAAAGTERGIAEFPLLPLDGASNFGDSGFHQTAPKAPLLQLPVDELAPDAAVIKVDVQGFEPEVLRGATATLASGRAIWMIERSARSEVRDEVFGILRAAGYDLFWFFSPFGTARSPRAPLNARELKGDANWVAAPAGRTLPWRLNPVQDAHETLPGDASYYPYLAHYGHPGG